MNAVMVVESHAVPAISARPMFQPAVSVEPVVTAPAGQELPDAAADAWRELLERFQDLTWQAAMPLAMLFVLTLVIGTFFCTQFFAMA
jgi:hypothetical protein